MCAVWATLQYRGKGTRISATFICATLPLVQAQAQDTKSTTCHTVPADTLPSVRVKHLKAAFQSDLHATEHGSRILACIRYDAGSGKNKSDAQAPDHMSEARNRISARQWTPYISSYATVWNCRAHCAQNQSNCSSVNTGAVALNWASLLLRGVITPRSKREAQCTPNEDFSVGDGPPSRTEPP